jgi:hypothetical protein
MARSVDRPLQLSPLTTATATPRTYWAVGAGLRDLRTGQYAWVREDEIVPPVFVCSDDGTLDSFDSVDRMIGYVEPVDVAEVAGAFDSTGRRLVLRAEGMEGGKFGTSFLDYAASGENAADELRAHLRDYVGRLADRARMTESEIETAPLHVLAAVASYWSRVR